MNRIWEKRNLGDIVDVLDNLRKPITKRDRVEGQYPYYGATGILSYVHSYIFSERLVLIGEDGAKWNSGDNTSFIADGYYWVNNHAHVIRPNREVITDEWIVYFLNFSDLTPFITGMTVPKLNQEKMRSIAIPLPSLSEQQRIVSILDKVFATIDKVKANTEQNLKNAREVFDSYLQNVFKEGNNNWEYKRLGDVCDTGAGGTPLKNHKDYYEGGNIPWLRSGEVNKKEITESELFITDKGLKNSSAKIFSINTVLVAMYGATAGQVGILRFECCTNQAICGILPNRNFIPEFLYYKFYAGKDSLVSQAVGGAQPNISQIKIKSTLIPVIPIKEQQSIVNKLDALEVETQKLEAIYNRKLDYLEELKKSVLHKAFSGNLNLDVEDSLINPILNQSTIQVNQE